jgi:structural maintenance of chromosome 3 (chondroitin sulfate proteoglycan 6)
MFVKKESLTTGELWVELSLANEDERFPLKMGSISFRKEITEDCKVIHYLGGLKVSPVEYYNILECGGLGRLKKFCLLSHRKIDEIINLSGEELYEAIKELTGAKVYEEKKEESVIVLEKTSKIKSK